TGVGVRSPAPSPLPRGVCRQVPVRVWGFQDQGPDSADLSFEEQFGKFDGVRTVLPARSRSLRTLEIPTPLLDGVQVAALSGFQEKHPGQPHPPVLFLKDVE